jgi:hypothetical protein
VNKKTAINLLHRAIATRAKVTKAKSGISEPEKFDRPVIIGSKSENRIRTILDERLDSLCTALGIESHEPARYRELAVFLLADVIGLKGFQVLQEHPRGRGNPFWTVQKQFALMKFVDERLKAGLTAGRAFALARNEFAPDRADDTLKVAYHRAVRLFTANPRTAALMALIDRSPKVARNFRAFLASPAMLKGKRK